MKDEPRDGGIPKGTSRLSRNPDGSLTLTPRTPTPTTAPPATPATIEDDVVKHAVKECSHDGEMTTPDSLDPCARIVIAAVGERAAKKKAEASEKN